MEAALIFGDAREFAFLRVEFLARAAPGAAGRVSGLNAGFEESEVSIFANADA
jgi:hypothetical protein